MGVVAHSSAGPGVFGPPKDRHAALAVLREAVARGVNHIDTSDFYGPHVINQLIREALHPYPDDLVIVTKSGAARGTDASWISALTPADPHRAPNILLIPGTSSIAHLHENLAAAELALTDTILAELDAIDGEGLQRTP
jgi:aryl-alcohol dehydrogenase-like predicted oxidoreductase